MELKNCPFCGSSAAFISKSETYGHGDFGVEWFVACVAKSCGAKVPSNDAYHQGEAEQKASAAASWNKRSEYVSRAAVLEEAAQVCDRESCYGDQDEYGAGRVKGCEACAEGIRALKSDISGRGGADGKA